MDFQDAFRGVRGPNVIDSFHHGQALFDLVVRGFGYAAIGQNVANDPCRRRTDHPTHETCARSGLGFVSVGQFQ
ncbi:MAG: hypothetical protein R3B96_02595 [Pirellulaceae bacterium]